MSYQLGGEMDRSLTVSYNEFASKNRIAFKIDTAAILRCDAVFHSLLVI